MPDGNWFYSTLAQSSAAIVGLAGGFFASRLIAHRELIVSIRRPLREDFRSVMLGASGLVVRLSESVEAMDGVLKRWDEGDALGSLTLAELWVPQYPPREFGSPPVPRPSPEDIDALRRARLELVQLTNELFKAVHRAPHRRFAVGDFELNLEPGAEWLRDWPLDEEPSFNPASELWSIIRRQETWVQHRWREFEDQFRGLGIAVGGLRSRLVPRSVFWLIGLLGALLFFCVLIPMTFLDASSTRSKTWLLIAFGLLSGSLVIFLVVEVLRIRRAADITTDF